MKSVRKPRELCVKGSLPSLLLKSNISNTRHPQCLRGNCVHIRIKEVFTVSLDLAHRSTISICSLFCLEGRNNKEGRMDANGSFWLYLTVCIDTARY